MTKVLRSTCPGACALAPGSKPAVLQCSSLTHGPMHCLSQSTPNTTGHGAGRELWGQSGAAHCCEHSCQSVLLQRMQAQPCCDTQVSVSLFSHVALPLPCSHSGISTHALHMGTLVWAKARSAPALGGCCG